MTDELIDDLVQENEALREQLSKALDTIASLEELLERPDCYVVPQSPDGLDRWLESVYSEDNPDS
jgi:hypothetical protein